MLRAVRRKFEAHSALQRILLSTGDEEIVEVAPNAYYWGCGADGTGHNGLSHILMLVRPDLQGTELCERRAVSRVFTSVQRTSPEQPPRALRARRCRS